MGEVKYVDEPSKWPILAEHLRRAGEFGYDTETYGQPDKTSPAWRAKVHCFSIGVLTKIKTQWGYHKAVGVVCPVDAFTCRELVDVFTDPTINKWAHNAPHDYHSTVNMGVDIRGLHDSLQWFRVAYPGRNGYGLKQIAQWALGYGPRPTFTEMVTYANLEVTARGRVEKGCVCGVKPCHQRSNKQFLADDGVYCYHTRVTWKRFTPISKVVDRRYEVTDFYKGATLKPLRWNNASHDRWEEWLNYSAEDAIQGIEAVDWLRNYKFREIKYPWVM